LILLDTSFVIRSLVKGSREDRELRGWLSSGESLGISTIAMAEFLCGPVDVREVELLDQVIPLRVPFADEDPVLASKLFNESGRRRGSLIDCMIAATALRIGAAVATENSADFRRFERAGLIVLSF
jgi:predicted nucleic acid-binding protein